MRSYQKIIFLDYYSFLSNDLSIKSRQAGTYRIPIKTERTRPPIKVIPNLPKISSEKMIETTQRTPVTFVIKIGTNLL